METSEMRTTIEIDDDVFAFARGQAQREHIAIGEMISRLAREGMSTQATRRSQPAKPKSKFALLPARDEIITTQHVRDLMSEEGV